jgi:hypothetical protein
MRNRYSFISVKNNNVLGQRIALLDGVVDPLAERSVLLDVLAHRTVGDDAALLAVLLVVFAVERREAPLARVHNQLAARELELGTAESLDGVISVLNHKL